MIAQDLTNRTNGVDLDRYDALASSRMLGRSSARSTARFAGDAGSTRRWSGGGCVTALERRDDQLKHLHGLPSGQLLFLL